MKRESYCIEDIECNVVWVENITAPVLEEGHGLHYKNGGVEITLVSVEVEFWGLKVEMMHTLNDKQKEKIIDEIINNH